MRSTSQSVEPVLGGWNARVVVLMASPWRRVPYRVVPRARDRGSSGSAPPRPDRRPRGRSRGSGAAGPRSRQASASQVEDRLRCQLSLGRAMGALDVVGEDLELGLTVDLDAVGEEQMLVGLGGVGLLSVRAHDDSSVEDRSGRAVEHTLVELLAGATW